MSSNILIEATRSLSSELQKMDFGAAAAFVYNPLEYAREIHETYLARHACGRKRVVFLGMNPGPYGMAQTGIPFGEVSAVRSFLHIEGPVGKPAREHPHKPVEGFSCKRSEVSGRRLWGFFEKHFGNAESFFREHYVHNYCPLLFIENTRLGRNLTPEQLSLDRQAEINKLCDAFLRLLLAELHTELVVGVGGFAWKRAQEALAGRPVRICRVLHPSPANPAANRGWEEAALESLKQAGAWLKTAQ
ncbi:MAG: single-stranded DNA-binding protein [Puniceicoccales bacterium]|jgi:single-strand selective monofunctional uracil DNA glycosylase|nr:single-stranded DNA-binding protein [Puniceicoccales bacterium]